MSVPFIFATMPTGNVPASDLDADFAYLLNNSPVVSIANFLAAGVVADGTHDCTSALQAAIATGSSVYLGAGEFPTTAQFTLSVAGQRLIGVPGDKTRIVKWGNVVLVDLEGDSSGLIGVTLVGQFNRALAISSGFLNAAAPVVVDTTSNLTIGAAVVGVTDSPTNATLIGVRSRFAGLDGIDWQEGEALYMRDTDSVWAARWGFTGTGSPLGRGEPTIIGCEASFCGNGTQALGGGWGITWHAGSELSMSAHSNIGPGIRAGTLAKFNKGVIYDELNGVSNTGAVPWVTATLYGVTGVVTNTWTVSTTTTAVAGRGTAAVPLLVTSGLNIPNGTAITIAGAGPGGTNYKGLVVSGGGTNSLVLEYPTSTTVSGAAVAGAAQGLFVCTIGGTSGATPPTVAAGTVSDGGVTWQARSGNAIELLSGLQNDFYALDQQGPTVVSNSYSAGIFNNIDGAAEANPWFNSGLRCATQTVSLTQFSRYSDPVFSSADTTINQSFDMGASVPGSPSVFRWWAPGTASQTSASIVWGDATGQQETPGNIPIRISGPTLSGTRNGGHLTNIKSGSRVYPSTISTTFDYSTSGISGGAVDASEANTYLCDATTAAFNFNIEGGGTGSAPGDWIRVVKLDTGGNPVTVKGTGFYIAAGGSNTQTAMSGGVAVSSTACDITFELLSQTAGSGSTALWLKRAT